MHRKYERTAESLEDKGRGLVGNKPGIAIFQAALDKGDFLPIWSLNSLGERILQSWLEAGIRTDESC